MVRCFCKPNNVFILSILFGFSISNALNCYTTVYQVTPIPINSKPLRTLACDLLMDNNDETGQFEALSKLQRTDEENYKNLPACYSSCSGRTRAGATCTYSCTRQQSCLMLEQISKTMKAKSEIEAATGALCQGKSLSVCQPHYYSFQCCMDDLCNSSTAHKLDCCLIFLFIACVSTLFFFFSMNI
jgi:hypothetical protein